MTGQALRQGLISEQTIRDALTTSRGDLFLAASYLNVTPRELDQFIRSSSEIQGFVATIAVVKNNSDYDRLSAEQFSDQLENLARAYRVEAIDVIHELAVMPFDSASGPMSAAMAEVKLKAAVQLRGTHSDTPQNSDQASILAELNNLYQQSAPRIKSIRIAQIEMGE